MISIHAPRVGCDLWLGLLLLLLLGISIHAPRVGCDYPPFFFFLFFLEFQSTHPVWGATTARFG